MNLACDTQLSSGRHGSSGCSCSSTLEPHQAPLRLHHEGPETEQVSGYILRGGVAASQGRGRSHASTSWQSRSQRRTFEARSLSIHWRISWTPHHSFRWIHFAPIMNSAHTLAMLRRSLSGSPSTSDGNVEAAFITAFAGISIVALSKYRFQSLVQHDRAAIHELEGRSRFSAWPSLSRRYDLLHSTWEKTGAELFEFRVPQVRCLISISTHVVITAISLR